MDILYGLQGRILILEGEVEADKADYVRPPERGSDRSIDCPAMGSQEITQHVGFLIN